ncbi:MAG TPA: tetratricopeptide repeat protein [Mycobacteriales bacterium]|nr:tetratricopeptide repeat protein [Mycobacteriales bacterium]
MAQPQQETLADRLGRFPAERYPVQHATTQFHLGSQLLQRGHLEPAVEALTVARELFSRVGMRLEAAKSTVMLGVAHRSASRLDDAARAFTAAGEDLSALHQPAEEGAAAYNLGLVRQDAGDREAAHAAWMRAREMFLSAGLPARAAAAARDHGASLLAAGDAQAALPLLEQAAALAERAGDDPGTAVAANALGLAHLAAGDAPAAVGVLRRALAFVPRTTRPGDHAMVKANLALAHEQAGSTARARLCAVQALAVAGAAPPVRAQAQALLARLPGRPHEDLLTVLDAEPREEWVPLLREEAVRVAELPAERAVTVRAFLDGVLARPESAYDLAQALLDVLLELPPSAYTPLVAAVVEACADRPEQEQERLRAVVGSAMARFALPQWQRVAIDLNRAAERAGQPAAWR